MPNASSASQQRVLVGEFEDEFLLDIDYRKSVTDMIECGNYSKPYDFSDITPEGFPIEGEGVHQVKARLMWFPYVGKREVMQQSDILAAFRDYRVEACSFEHLLAVGAQYPEAQLRVSIIPILYRGFHCKRKKIVLPILHSNITRSTKMRFIYFPAVKKSVIFRPSARFLVKDANS